MNTQTAIRHNALMGKPVAEEITTMVRAGVQDLATKGWPVKLVSTTIGYVRDEASAAPIVVAKGQELLALKIREEAEERQIPVIEQPELARALYRSVEVGQLIPPEFYRAVAEIINFLATRRAT